MHCPVPVHSRPSTNTHGLGGEKGTQEADSFVRAKTDPSPTHSDFWAQGTARSGWQACTSHPLCSLMSLHMCECDLLERHLCPTQITMLASEHSRCWSETRKSIRLLLTEIHCESSQLLQVMPLSPSKLMFLPGVE